MAEFSRINVHGCARIRAEASGYESATWLTLHFDDGHHCVTSIFMPLDRAQRIADAINRAEDAGKAPVNTEEAA
jgi:hypothetical protein